VCRRGFRPAKTSRYARTRSGTFPDAPEKDPALVAWTDSWLCDRRLFILPPITRHLAVRQLGKLLDRKVSIHKIKLNPFALAATVRGLRIKDKDGQVLVSWDEVYVNFQLPSFLGHPWVFKEISATRPFLRIQVNKDDSLNFSDLLQRFSGGSGAATPAPARLLALSIDHLRVSGGLVAVTDLTPRTPFRHQVGPFDLALNNFRTAPDNANPYSFIGTTDSGETLAWSGSFSVDPLRSRGEMKVQHLPLAKYAALFQDLVRFEIKDGRLDFGAAYDISVSDTDRVACLTNAVPTLHSFKLAERGAATDTLDIDGLSLRGLSADLVARRARVESFSLGGARAVLRRGRTEQLNLVTRAQPPENRGQSPGGVLMLVRSITNIVAELLKSTNAWSANLGNLAVRDSGLSFTDLSPARPVSVGLDQIGLQATNLSNVPGAECAATLSFRWNTNGTGGVDVRASPLPTAIEAQAALRELDLRTLDAYLEPWFNVFIRRSNLGLDADCRFRAVPDSPAELTLKGDLWLDDFRADDARPGAARR
jgi:hypothetical protein